MPTPHELSEQLVKTEASFNKLQQDYYTAKAENSEALQLLADIKQWDIDQKVKNDRGFYLPTGFRHRLQQILNHDTVTPYLFENHAEDQMEMVL